MGFLLQKLTCGLFPALFKRIRRWLSVVAYGCHHLIYNMRLCGCLSIIPFVPGASEGLAAIDCVSFIGILVEIRNSQDVVHLNLYDIDCWFLIYLFHILFLPYLILLLPSFRSRCRGRLRAEPRVVRPG